MTESTTFVLHKLVFALDKAADTLLKEVFNISYSRALVLVLLQDQPGITQHELAQALGHSDPAASVMLVELTKAGYVTSSPSPHHKRKKQVTLTARGEELAVKAHTYLNQKLDYLLSVAGVDGEIYTRLTHQLYATLIREKK